MKELLILYLATISIAALSENACNKRAWSPSTKTYPFTLMSLPYDNDYLTPYISEGIVIAHHDFHHKAYMTKLNTYLATVPELQETSLLSLIQNAGNVLALQNFAGGYFNHNML